MEKRSWRNPKKNLDESTEGYCKFCHKKVKSLEAHIKIKHKEKKS